jgi:flavin-dependent dehydrogenase
MKNYDVIIIGGGPGGSVLGALLANQGKKVAIVERERFPRFHIGESLLPASMPLYKETGFYDTLASGKYIRKNGARFVDYRSDDEIYFGFAEGLNRDIPMAFEVERSEFDKDILEHAVKCGVDLYQPERVKTVEFFPDHVKVITNNQELTAKFIADCTGRESLLGKQFAVRSRHEDLNNVAVFAHFTGVKRNPGNHEGDIVIALLPQAAWGWIIPFKGDRTSVGIVCNAKAYKGGVDLSEYMQENFASSSRLSDYMKDSERVSEITPITAAPSPEIAGFLSGILLFSWIQFSRQAFMSRVCRRS